MKRLRIRDRVITSHEACTSETSLVPEDPFSQIHSPHLYVGAPGIFSDFLRSVQMLKRERESGVRKATGSYRTYSIPGRTAALFHEFAVEDLPSVELRLGS